MGDVAMNQMWRVIMAIALVGVVGVASGFYVSQMINENITSNNTAAPNSGEEENNSQSSEDPLMIVANNTVVKSYYAVSDDTNHQTNLILIIHSPGLYKLWHEKSARFYFFDEKNQFMPLFAAHSEHLENISSNDDYKITFEGGMYFNLCGLTVQIALSYYGLHWDYCEYDSAYPITTLHFYVNLKVTSYLIAQMAHGNDQYSIMDFQYLNISNDGNCPYYFYLNPNTLEGPALVVQGKTIVMHYSEGPRYIKNGLNTYKFLVDVFGEVTFSGGYWPAQIIFYDLNDQSKSVSVGFTIHIGE